MKILHINCADFGSTGKAIKDISEYVDVEGHKSYLLVPKINYEDAAIQKKATSLSYEQGLYRRISALLGFRYGFAPLSTSRILMNIKKIKPDVVHLHSINCNMVNIYKLVKYLKKKHIPTVATNHAEFFYTGSCEHAYPCQKWKTGCGKCDNYRVSCNSFWDSSGFAWKKMKDAFCEFKEACIVSVSPYVYSRSLQSPVFDGITQKMILNGINTKVFYRRKEIKDEIKKDKGKKTVVATTAHFNPLAENRKGGAYLVELARRFEKENVNFLVVGNAVNTGMQLPKNLKVIGKVSNQDDLAQYYSVADISVITSSRETFSMPVAESLACGTPVIGFFAGGPESIAINEYCKFVEFGNVDALENALREEWLNKKKSINFEELSEKTRQKYSSEIMAQKYLDIYKEIMK